MFNIVKAVMAQPVNIGKEYPPAKTGFTSVSSLINILLPNILTIAGIIALIFTIGAGLTFIMHAGKGESDKAGKDKNAFTAAIIGLMIIFGAYIFLTIMETLTGYSFLNPKM